MLIAICLAALLAAPPDDVVETPAVQAATAPAKDAARKPKKKKKAPKESEAAPDDQIDVDAVEHGGGVRFVWKQHPSLRFGDLARVDFEAKLQEDAHSSYGPVKGLDPWEFHRNRLGVQGICSSTSSTRSSASSPKRS